MCVCVCEAIQSKKEKNRTLLIVQYLYMQCLCEVFSIVLWPFQAVPCHGNLMSELSFLLVVLLCM